MLKIFYEPALQEVIVTVDPAPHVLPAVFVVLPPNAYILWDDQELLNQKDAPFDQGKETLELLMKNKYEITAEDIANVSKI